MPFQKGHPGGPGRPPRAVEDAQHSVLLELFDEDAERAIVTNMIRIAKRGSIDTSNAAISAATWLWDRKYGKVKEKVELSGQVDLKGYTTKDASPDAWDEPDFSDAAEN